MRIAIVALCVVASAAVALAQGRPGSARAGLGDLGSSREPISIDADRVDVFDKEGRAVFSGNVVAVQGDSTMNCSAMNVHYEGGRAAGMARGLPGAATAAVGAAPAATTPVTAAAPATAATPAKPAATGGLPGGDAIKRIECRGPVTITSKTQVATGDRAEFDKTRNKVYLIGSATLSDGPNVTKGERVSYDLNTGIASVEGGREGGRVRALIVPSGAGKAATPAATPPPQTRPR